MKFTVTAGSRELVLETTGRVNTVAFAVPEDFVFAVVDHPEELVPTIVPTEGHAIGMTVTGAGRLSVAIDGALLDAGVSRVEVPSLL